MVNPPLKIPSCLGTLIAVYNGLKEFGAMKRYFILVVIYEIIFLNFVICVWNIIVWETLLCYML